MSDHRGSRPLLVYDGDCGFCLYWVNYWRKLTEDRIAYAPYQEAAGDHPAIPIAEFQRAVQFIAPDGKTASGAEACFLVLSFARGMGFWLTLYRTLPGFAAITELVYAFVASHRTAFSQICYWLWGRDYSPPTFDLVAWLFLRAMGLIYLSAFVSFGVQAMGLIGSHGILPLSGYIAAIENQIGPERYRLFPMVFWIDSSDFAIQAACWLGALFSILLIFNFLPRLSLLLLYVLYLSLVYAGQEFMTFQWDSLLLESGFLALFLTIAQRPGIYLLRWLMFRLMFMSGVVKLMSRDPNWANLTALTYHFQTQPLPTPLAWYAHHLPHRTLVAATAGNFVVELALPILIFFPRRPRFLAAFGFIALEALIALTGNYTFFNFLTIALCLPLFDDAAVTAILPQRLAPVRRQVRIGKPRKLTTFAADALGVLIVFAYVIELPAIFGVRLIGPAAWFLNEIEPLRIVNSYGLFAVMTTKRNEIVIEGSNDGEHWQEYAFRYKPGDLHRPPPWNAPYQPRLDWQMWFAALGTPEQNPWLSGFITRLLENSPDVTALLAYNPFPDKPPRYVRAIMYDYRFTTPEEKAATGDWWVRTPEGMYFPPVGLADPATRSGVPES
ncbi:MAG TPA: lipase maturation factor family protein [Candidatus Binataceae bacterium]|nr:lipase maturation factor family protein [Candidatus Binataceae bacterium]